MHKSIIKIFLCINSLCVLHGYYFYNPNNNFGSDGYFNPVNAIVNGSYDILRHGSWGNRDIINYDYAMSNKIVYYNISNPTNHIKKFGTKKFIELEIFNLTLDPDKGQFVPNIASHVIGNGMLYVKMEEWYDHHNYKHPKLLSVLSTTFYQYMNEIIEHFGEDTHVSVDPIADILIFNPLGILLFSFDPVKNFFSKTFPIYDWSSQPIFMLNNNHLENTGQNYMVRRAYKENQRIQPFIYYGIHAIFGLSYQAYDNKSLSIGAGGVVRGTEGSFIDNEIKHLTPFIDGTIGFFIDKNNSLLVSTIITGPEIYNIELNIYPNTIKINNFSPGIFCAYREVEGFMMGLSLQYLPTGLGLFSGI